MREEYCLGNALYIRNEDHPRACGKNVLLRGHCLWWPGITPAHAGRIGRCAVPPCCWQDHPRACGKNAPVLISIISCKGSPPRMREELKQAGEALAQHWITPAHAGRMSFANPFFAVNEDHPRACGKNLINIRRINFCGGSPPRMREECGAFKVRALQR